MQDDLKPADRRTRKLMTMHGTLHPSADVARMYVSRKEGGRGLQNIHDVVTMEKSNLKRYVLQSDAELTKLAAPILWPYLDAPPDTSHVVKCASKRTSLGVDPETLAWAVCPAIRKTDQREYLELADKGWSQEGHGEPDHRDPTPGLGN